MTAADPPQVRAEGFTELSADLMLTCTGGIPTPAGMPIPTANITVFFNVNVTSRVYGNFEEAILLIDEPGTASNPEQLACASSEGCTVLGTAVGGVPGPTPFNGAPGRPNIFPGQRGFSENSLVFRVPVDPPGPATRRYRIKNVRVNAAMVGDGGQVVAFLSFLPPVQVFNAQQVVASVQTGMEASIWCPAWQPVPFTVAMVQFSERFPTAFKSRTVTMATGIAGRPHPPQKQNILDIRYEGESGFFNPDLIGPYNLFSTGGLADTGTRLALRLINIPIDAELRVTAKNLNLLPNQLARLMMTDVNGAGQITSPAEQSFGLVKVPVLNGTALAVWEVVAADPQSVQTYTFALSLTRNGAATSTARLIPDLAPFYPSGGAEGTSPVLPIPRFAASTAIPTNLCTTQR